jgi:hypothetical protein
MAMRCSGGKRRAREQIHLSALFVEHGDASYASASVLQVRTRLGEAERFGVVALSERDGGCRGALRQAWVRRTLVRHELTAFITQRRHRLRKGSAAIEREEQRILIADDGAKRIHDGHHPLRE